MPHDRAHGILRTRPAGARGLVHRFPRRPMSLTARPASPSGHSASPFVRSSSALTSPIERSAYLGLMTFLLASAIVLLTACGGSAQGKASEGETSGAAFEPKITLSPFDKAAAIDSGGALIDTSHVAQGYVAVSATSPSRLKFEVAHNGTSYYYDLPGDGTPIVCPLNMGNGTYSFCAWENTSGTRYVALSNPVSAAVSLADEFQPYIRPNQFCDFDEASESTRLAKELCADAQNEGDALRAVCE